MPWTLPEDQTLALPLDELGLRILQDYVQSRGWNWRNWLLEQQIPRERTQLQSALEEGWGWLISQGLVVRDIQQSSSEAVRPSRLGREVLDRGLGDLRASQQIRIDLHPEIRDTAKRQFAIGEPQLAVFGALRAVEVRVRALCDYPPDVVGVPMMRAALGNGGPLRDPDATSGEQQALSDLFAGAIGAFKNPESHRDVEYEDPAMAAGVVMLADVLMRILDRAEVRMQK
jgi:uncharacterized protein (TIGR02391 family)